MNDNDYCTYDQALALKKAGFDYPCYELWDMDFADDHSPVRVRRISDSPRTTVMRCSNTELDNMAVNAITAPSLATAQKWLREKKNVDVYVIPRHLNAYEVAAKQLGANTLATFYLFDLWDSTKPYPTYEAALSAGITEALELLPPFRR